MQHLDDPIFEIKSDVKDIKNDILEIKVTLARNTDGLDYHIKRTDILQKKVDHVDAHIILLNGLLRLGALAAACIGSAWGLIQIYAFFVK